MKRSQRLPTGPITDSCIGFHSINGSDSLYERDSSVYLRPNLCIRGRLTIENYTLFADDNDIADRHSRPTDRRNNFNNLSAGHTRCHCTALRPQPKPNDFNIYFCRRGLVCRWAVSLFLPSRQLWRDNSPDCHLDLLRSDDAEKVLIIQLSFCTKLINYIICVFALIASERKALATSCSAINPVLKILSI